MITLLGKKSQLAQCLKEKIQFPVDILSSDDIDLRDEKNIEIVLKKFSNKILINCFAFNDVEGAEYNQDAYKINHIGIQQIAKFCADNNIIFIHISTDFLFDGKKGLTKFSGAGMKEDYVTHLLTFYKFWLKFKFIDKKTKKIDIFEIQTSFFQVIISIF